MTLKQWADNGWLKPHATSPQEIHDLLAAVERDRADAQKDLSPDWRFNIAYNAARGLCTVALYASGYRADRDSSHFYTIGSLAQILGKNAGDLPRLLDQCRKKRNIATYESVGAISSNEADELLKAVGELDHKLRQWLRANHTELLP
jgi:hypothetical protein